MNKRNKRGVTHKQTKDDNHACGLVGAPVDNGKYCCLERWDRVTCKRCLKNRRPAVSGKGK